MLLCVTSNSSRLHVQALTAELRKLDAHVGRMYEGACKGALLIVATCQGDTASVRLMHVRPTPPVVACVCFHHHV